MRLIPPLNRPAFVLSGLIAAFAAVTAAEAQTTLPDGMIGINYNRCDSKYDDWGLHAWRNPNIPLDDITWGKPMMPNGKSDFGVSWQIPLKDFGSSGNVNYIIHKGEVKDQGGRDQKFDGKTTREVWVNSGDSKIYTSLDDAKKARADKPCT